MIQKTKSTDLFLASMVLLGSFALIAQFYININSKIAPLPEILIRYFSYFTILSNIIVVICCTTLLIKPNTRLTDFIFRQTTLTAVTVYIIIVGLVYNIILRFLWNPQGLQLIVDEILHAIIPILFLLFWLLYIPKNELAWKHVYTWLRFPFVYVLFILIRGSFSGFYPYPFIDAKQLGLNKVLVNAGGLTVVFFVCSILFVGLGKLLSRRSTLKS